MGLDSPPIQEVTANESGLFPQIWVRWFQYIADSSGPTAPAPVTTVITSTTLVSEHSTVLCDATSGALTITLPTAASASGRKYVIKKTNTSANDITIDAAGSEVIDNALTQVLSGATFPSITIQSDGVKWWIL